MAGGGDQKDNPVAINVVPMVDVIFCLCIFFMCSFKFKELEGKFESWLPKNKGADSPMKPDALIEEIRVMMVWDDANERLIRKLGHNQIDDDEKLGNLIDAAHQDHVRLNKPDTPVIIDAGETVPWMHIINVMNIIKSKNIEKIEFAMGKDIGVHKKK